MKLKQFNREFQKEETKEFFNGNLRRFIERGENITLSIGDIDHILDYLESDSAPKRFQKMNMYDAHKKAQEWTSSLKKKGSHINETEEDVEVLFDFEDGMKIVQLVGENAFKREGFLMSHCVSSYFDKKGSSVLSLRDNKNIPHCKITYII